MIDLDLKLTPTTDWRTMPTDERKRALFQKQKDLLDTFLSRGAIDRRQYEMSVVRSWGSTGTHSTGWFVQ